MYFENCVSCSYVNKYRQTVHMLWPVNVVTVACLSCCLPEISSVRSLLLCQPFVPDLKCVYVELLWNVSQLRGHINHEKIEDTFSNQLNLIAYIIALVNIQPSQQSSILLYPPMCFYHHPRFIRRPVWSRTSCWMGPNNGSTVMNCEGAVRWSVLFLIVPYHEVLLHYVRARNMWGWCNSDTS